MATVKQAIREHDVVALLDPIDKAEAAGSWSMGTVGTVLDQRGELRLVEIADQGGVTLDYVVVTADRLELVAPPRPPARTGASGA
jgi:hypothetical protein